MDDIKKLRADIIIALLSNPNHTPHITHHIVKPKGGGIAAILAPTKPINESTIAIAEQLIHLIESELASLDYQSDKEQYHINLRRDIMLELIRKRAAEHSTGNRIINPIPLEHECERIYNYVIGKITINLEELVKASNA